MSAFLEHKQMFQANGESTAVEAPPVGPRYTYCSFLLTVKTWKPLTGNWPVPTLLYCHCQTIPKSASEPCMWEAEL
jgi:hypothetical protein